jgi:hypothetical protein
LVIAVLAALERGKEQGGTNGDSVTELRTIRISELRWKAPTTDWRRRVREMLIAALKEYSSEEEDSEDDEDLRESLFMLVRGPVTRVRQFISTRG